MEYSRGAGLRCKRQADCSGSDQARPHGCDPFPHIAIDSGPFSSSGRNAQSSILAVLLSRQRAIMMSECSHKADEAKVLPRDRTAQIQHCLDER